MIADGIPAIKPFMSDDFNVIDDMLYPCNVPKIHELRTSVKINPLFEPDNQKIRFL